MVTTVLQGVLSGVSRQLLESDSPKKQFELFRRELVRILCAYLEQSTLPVPANATDPD